MTFKPGYTNKKKILSYQMPRYNQKIKLLKKILRDALFFINWKKLNNTVEIAITGIYTHHETIRNVHMYKHIQNQNEKKLWGVPGPLSHYRAPEKYK